MRKGKDTHMWIPEDIFVELVLSILHVFWGSNSSPKAWSAGEFTHLAISLTPEGFFVVFFFAIKAANAGFVISNF